MQVVKKSLMVLLVLWFAIVFFMPKQYLYYKLETLLLQNDIKINESHIDEGVFSLKLHNLKVYVKGIELADVEEIEFFTILFYTKVKISRLLLDASLKSVAPTSVEKIEAFHAIWNPLEINTEVQGDFGSALGKVYLLDRHMRIDINSTKAIELFGRSLKQDNKGWFYETDF